MRVVVLPWSSWLLVGFGSIACACAGELAAGEGEAASPVAAVDRASAPSSEAAVAVDPAEAAAPRPAADAAPAERPRETGVPFDSRWLDEVRAVVATYESWGRLDDEARWGPWLCRMPRAATARISDSGDPDTHGDKLYTLYALDPEAYGAPPTYRIDEEPPSLLGMSQVIVKESFSPVLVDHATESKLGAIPSGGVGAHGLQPAERDGRRFVAGDHRGLFVMMKADGVTEGTDAGWIYATVEPDMITVTAVGVIDSCAGCHAEAGDDRLFGLPRKAIPPAPR